MMIWVSVPEKKDFIKKLNFNLSQIEDMKSLKPYSELYIFKNFSKNPLWNKWLFQYTLSSAIKVFVILKCIWFILFLFYKIIMCTHLLRYLSQFTSLLYCKVTFMKGIGFLLLNVFLLDSVNIFNYLQAVTTPSMAVSHIMMEAYKKFILVALIVQGKVSFIFSP